jgi:N-acetylglucosaminyl-diphospho-decaprenol L-rhamnosyltransferase
MGEVHRTVTLVVLNWKNEAATTRCVDSLRAMEYSELCEIVVVDNESTPRSRAALEGLGVRTVPLQNNRGFAGGMNAGIAAAQGAVVGLLNNDLVADGAWLAEGLRVLADESVGMVGGRVFVWDGSSNLVEDGVGEDLVHIDPDRGFGVLGAAPANEQRMVGIDGSNILARSDLLKGLGGFDESFFAYYEDIDLSARVLAARFEIVFTPAMKVWHRRGTSSDQVPYRRAYWATRNQYYVIAKHLPKSVWVRAVLALTIENLAAVLLGHRGGVRSPGRRLRRAERWGMTAAVGWFLVHPLRLLRVRQAVIASGHHDEEWATKIRGAAHAQTR